MNSIVIAFFACLALANAGVLVAPSAKIIQGPSSRTTVVGPDGSSISSETPGGAIIEQDHSAVVAHAAPAVAYSAPAISYSAPAIAYSAPALTYSAPTLHAPLAYSAYSPHPLVSTYSAPLGYSAPLAYTSGVVNHRELDTLVAGPSGTIATTKNVASPALVAAPQVYAAGVHGYYL